MAWYWLNQYFLNRVLIVENSFRTFFNDSPSSLFRLNKYFCVSAAQMCASYWWNEIWPLIIVVYVDKFYFYSSQWVWGTSQRKERKGNLLVTVAKIDQHLYVCVCLFLWLPSTALHSLEKNEEREVVFFARLIPK